MCVCVPSPLFLAVTEGERESDAEWENKIYPEVHAHTEGRACLRTSTVKRWFGACKGKYESRPHCCHRHGHHHATSSAPMSRITDVPSGVLLLLTYM